ncbi:BON domain-containing protein [Ramlibacter sp. AW1]|uniref:BON domain-containing protein n=1 Tax=Ramlibacter aurantiacus TaxID=2801330 RepID=A0A936ZN62_9BURK|nr:BON domain-containing protein [Ramlibacter aurantiacus]MBL0423253.1 BON domain-containing protein [Ramlibacter aurantiacus]
MKHMQRLLLSTLCATVLAGGLTACAPLVLGGAAMTALVAMDRRTSGAQLEDQGIEMRAASQVRAVLGDRGNVNITSYNRQVLLTGEVPEPAQRQLVEDVVAKVENVRGVVNELVVGFPSSLTQRSSDTLLTGRVRAALVDARDLSAPAFKVVTERGSVYLMGRVTQREADRAGQVARNVSGVQRVVRIFEIISEDELGRITTVRQPAASQAPAPVSR